VAGVHDPVEVVDGDDQGLCEAARRQVEGGVEQVEPAPPEQVGRTLYRIVQEALTNARKHAAGAHVSVRLDGDPESGVSVVVRNAKRVGARTGPAAPSSGLGLVGLRERAALAGGSLVVEDTTESFTLRGWLPWTT